MSLVVKGNDIYFLSHVFGNNVTIQRMRNGVSTMVCFIDNTSYRDHGDLKLLTDKKDKIYLVDHGIFFALNEMNDLVKIYGIIVNNLIQYQQVVVT